MTALASVAAGSLRSPSALLVVRRSLTPALGRAHRSTEGSWTTMSCTQSPAVIAWSQSTVQSLTLYP